MSSLRAAVVVLAVTLIVSVTATAARDLVVRGDAKAWAEIEAAFIKFTKVKSYRTKGSVTGGGTFLMEIVNPDKFHHVMDFGGVKMETIQVGKEVRFRQGGGPWMCTGQPVPVLDTDPQKLTGEVTAAKGPAAVIDGVQTQSYTYTWKDQQITTYLRLFVAKSNGLPKRIEDLNDKGGVQSTFDYFDYDAPITITLPVCR